MRGALDTQTQGSIQGGIIPADAGSTRLSPMPHHELQDHPRGCGEHVTVLPRSAPSMGSSPRMRGTPGYEEPEQGCGRIIPADAGNTRRLRNPKGLRWDHPRGCGEHTFSASNCAGVRGSSPRMRGTPVYDGVHFVVHGIIPADAGNTNRQGKKRGRSQDHPRGCGEHKEMDFAAWNKGGSSPRMRGTLTRIASISPRTRIIPADAGNTAPAALFWTGTGDHPRGCGEHAMYRVAANESWGSSPRMRGTPPRGLWTCVCTRIIPADAGNTGKQGRQ